MISILIYLYFHFPYFEAFFFLFVDLPSDQIINVESFSELQRYEEELTDIQFLTKGDVSKIAFFFNCIK